MPRQNACKTHRRRCIHTSSAQLRQQCLLAASRISSAETGPQGQDGWGGAEGRSGKGGGEDRPPHIRSHSPQINLSLMDFERSKKEKEKTASGRALAVCGFDSCLLGSTAKRETEGEKRCVDVLCKWWWQWGGAAKHASTSLRPVARR